MERCYRRKKMERRQSQQERRIPSASLKPEMPNARRTGRSGEKSTWQSQANKRSDGRTSGGSRYADNATPVKRASGKGRRPAGRKRRRRNQQLLIILFLLVLIVCLSVGIALVHSRKIPFQFFTINYSISISILSSNFVILPLYIFIYY